MEKHSNEVNSCANEICENDANELLTNFDYQIIDRIMSSSEDDHGDSKSEIDNLIIDSNIINNGDVKEDDGVDYNFSEISNTKGASYEVLKNMLMGNIETDNYDKDETNDLKKRFDDMSSSSYVDRSNHHQLQQKEKSFLLIPYLVRDFVNAGDMPSIIRLINQNFTEDCLFKTPAITKRKEGRNFIIEYFQSILRCIPDVIVTCSNNPTFKSSTVAGRKSKIIFSDILCTGTVICRDRSDYLWNDICNREKNKAYVTQLRERVSSFFKRFIQAGINTTGFAINMHNEITLQMTLNSDKTMIENVVITRRSLKLKMVRP